jgi:hypothetical protein
VRVFKQKFTLDDASSSQTCSLEVSRRVTNGIPVGSSRLLSVGTVNCVETLKAAVAGLTTTVDTTTRIPRLIVLVLTRGDASVSLSATPDHHQLHMAMYTAGLLDGTNIIIQTGDVDGGTFVSDMHGGSVLNRILSSKMPLVPMPVIDQPAFISGVPAF